MNDQMLRNRFYRVSAKALVLNEARDAFLICHQKNGKWELPGGGLDWGELPQEGLTREIKEEMNLEVSYIAPTPSYFTTNPFEVRPGSGWAACVVYETRLESLDFTPSDECQAIAWVNQVNQTDYDLYESTQLLVAQFNPANHQ